MGNWRRHRRLHHVTLPVHYLNLSDRFAGVHVISALRAGHHNSEFLRPPSVSVAAFCGRLNPGLCSHGEQSDALSVGGSCPPLSTLLLTGEDAVAG